MAKETSPHGEEFDTRITEINLRTALANAQLGQDYNGVYLYCEPVAGDPDVIDRLIKKMGIAKNEGGVISPGYHYDVMEGKLAICGDDAVKAIIASGLPFPGIEMVGQTLGVTVPSPKKFTERS